jgi:uncharacterized protein (TIGR04222 family)
MNPLDLTGAAFLELFIVAWLAVIGVLLAVRNWLTRGSDAPASADELAVQLAGGKLPTSVAAYVSGGIECAIEAAVAGLHHEGALHVEAGMLVPDPPEPVLQPDGTYRGMVVAPAPALMPAEAFVMAELEQEPQTVGGLIRRATSLDDQLRTQMLADGLIVPEVARTGTMLCAGMLGLTWFALGLTKVVVGASRDRPVGLLLILLFVGGWPLFKLFLEAPRVTRKGKEMLRLLRDHTSSLATTATSAPQQLDGRKLALAYVLAGAEMVGATELLELMPSYQRKLAEALRTSPT